MNYRKNTYIEDGETKIHIMAEDGRSYAELNYYDQEQHNMWFCDLNVEKYCRKQGRGNDILKYSMKLAKKLGCKYLYLSAKKGSFMFDWYSRVGFTSYTENDGYIQMYKKL